MFDKSLRSLRFYLKMRGLIRQKNRQLRGRDEIIRGLNRKIFILQHRLDVEKLRGKGILVHGTRETRRAGP